jgi:hypothetical protein
MSKAQSIVGTRGLQTARTLLLFFLVVSGVAFVTATEASAAPCPSPGQTRVAPAWWYASGSGIAANGVRAPIKLQAGAVICGNYSDADSVSSWIALEPGAGGKIAQMGFIYASNSVEVKQLCRFWATGTGSPVHVTNCSSDNVGDTVYFMIRTIYSSDSNYYYQLNDCGSSSSYIGCTVRNVSELRYSNAVSLLAAEAYRGGCSDQVQGAPTYKVTYGNSNDPLQAQNSYGGPWAKRDYVEGTEECGHFQVAVNMDNSAAQTWDSTS